MPHMFVHYRGIRVALCDLNQMKLIYHVRKLGQQNHESFVLQMQIRCDVLQLCYGWSSHNRWGGDDKLLARCASKD